MIRRLTVLAACCATLPLAACSTTPEPAPMTQTPPAPKPPEPAPHAQEARAAQVTGSVSYLERVALSPEAVVRVEVVEVGADGAESVVGERTLNSPGQVPIAFSVEVPAGRVRPDGTYRARALITDGGRRFSTTEPVPVLTQGHPRQDVRVWVCSGG